MSTVLDRGSRPSANCQYNKIINKQAVDYRKTILRKMHIKETATNLVSIPEPIVSNSENSENQDEQICCLQSDDNDQEIKHDKPQEDNEELKAKLLRALEENIRLRSVIHDVTEVNKRWQKYNQERQGYVQKLLSTIKELQQKEVTIGESSSKVQDTTNAAKWENLQMENVVLQKDLDESEKRCRHYNDMLITTRQELAEKIELLQMQVKLQTEDFMVEKREKREALTTVEKYKEELVHLKNKVSEMDKNTNHSKVYVCTCPNNYGQEATCKVAELQRRQRSSQLHQVQVLPCQLIPRSSSVNGLNSRKSLEDSLSNGDSAVSLTSPPTSAEVQLTPAAHYSQVKQDRWFLVCPKCRKHFPPNLGLQFSSHIDRCQDMSLRSST